MTIYVPSNNPLDGRPVMPKDFVCEKERDIEKAKLIGEITRGNLLHTLKYFIDDHLAEANDRGTLARRIQRGNLVLVQYSLIGKCLEAYSDFLISSMEDQCYMPRNCFCGSDRQLWFVATVERTFAHWIYYASRPESPNYSEYTAQILETQMINAVQLFPESVQVLFVDEEGACL